MKRHTYDPQQQRDKDRREGEPEPKGLVPGAPSTEPVDDDELPF